MTSQIFANIYLNEFDRFVRHQIKPLGYVRYGDDFVLFMPTKQAALAAQKTAQAWLFAELCLHVHAKNNVIVRSRSGLQFLGHVIYPNTQVTVEASMSRKITAEITRQNIPSYQGMNITSKQAKQLPWLLLDE